MSRRLLNALEQLWAARAARVSRPAVSRTPEYRAYYAARGRCANPNATGYARWGGRGIEFRFASFEEFIADVGPRPGPTHSLDRIDNDGHYEPGNVRWATPGEQSTNRRHCPTCQCPAGGV